VAKLQTDLVRRTQRVLAHAAVVVPVNPMNVWVAIAKTVEAYQTEAYATARPPPTSTAIALGVSVRCGGLGVSLSCRWPRR
jgi:hypothetical protein